MLAKSSVTHWLGMVTYGGKFILNLSDKGAILRLLQNVETQWHWDKLEQDAFDLLKDCVASTQVLRYCSLEEPIIVTVESSSYGLGACLLQDNKPVAFASRSLSKSKKDYGQDRVYHCNSILRDLVEISYFNLRSLFNPVTDVLIGDGIHFNRCGTYKMYQAVQGVVCSGLNVMDRLRGGKPHWQ